VLSGRVGVGGCVWVGAMVLSAVACDWVVLWLCMAAAAVLLPPFNRPQLVPRSSAKQVPQRHTAAHSKLTRRCAAAPCRQLEQVLVQYYYKERALVAGVLAKLGPAGSSSAGGGSPTNKTVESVMSTKVGALILSYL
jgi:hypothetical protein